MKCQVAVVVAVMLALPSVASALDTVRTTKGTTLNGNITQVSAQAVVVKQSNGNEQSIAIDDIESIKFSGEPPQLNVARAAAQGGRYDEALRTLDKLMQDKKGLDRTEVLQDVQYLQAMASARQAIAGRGDLLNAGKQVRDFVQKNPNSFRFIEASEVLGDVLLAVDKPDLAQQQYATVQRLATSAGTKARAAVLQGQALLAQGEWQQAQAQFDEALSAKADSSPAVTTQQQLARLGKAVALAAMDKPDEGIALVQEVLASADPEQADLGARAYNALGTCLRKADRPKDALLAFLHVDVLYATEGAAHAEALKNLTELWPETGNAQRAAEAQEVLRTRYANSRWARGS